jgi:Protein of unknown function (DUF4038)
VRAGEPLAGRHGLLLRSSSYTRGADDASTFDGIPPFTPGDDLSTRNPVYFARMDPMVQLAAEDGITLLLDPAKTGSFGDDLQVNGVQKNKAYGHFLGQRYGNAPNIIWMFGNDYQPDQWRTYAPYLTALAVGIREAAPDDLKTVELNNNVSTSFDGPTSAGRARLGVQLSADLGRGAPCLQRNPDQ